MIGTGVITTNPKKDPAGPPFVATSAQNGASVQGGIIEWGQPAGVGPGGPADLLHNTEIPYQGFNVDWLVNAQFFMRFDGSLGALQWLDGLNVLQIIPQSSALVFSNTTFANNLVNFEFGTGAYLMSAAGSGFLGSLLTLHDADAARNVGTWSRHDAFAGTWSGQRIQNSDAGNTSRTQFEAINNGVLNAGVVLGIGAVANTIYPNTSYLSVGTSSPGLFIVSRAAAGFVAWSIGAEGTAGEQMRLVAGGRLGIRTVAPLGAIHLPIGLAAISGAPIALTPGVAVQTILENNRINYDGSLLYLSNGGTNFILPKTLTATAVLDFPSTAAGTSSDLTIAVAGSALGDIVNLGVPNASTAANGVFSAWVSVAGTVTVRFTNTNLVAAIDPASGTFRVSVDKY